MKSACIIIPHIDDDVYSCWSVLCDKSYDKIVIVKVTKGSHQFKREKIHNLMMTHPERYGLNPNIKIEWLFGDRDHSPEDGHSQLLDDMNYVTLLDKYTSQNFTEFYIPSLSHHQDHVLVYRTCIAALRPRSNNRIKRVFEYTYMYNHNTERAVCYKPMMLEDLEYKLACLQDIDECDPILDEDSINSVNYVKRSNLNFGSECGYLAAEKFILVFEIMDYNE